MPTRSEQSVKMSGVVNKCVGDIIRTVRLQQRLTQSEMAEALGIPQTVLSRVELGQRELGVRPWLAFIFKFAPKCKYYAKLQAGECCDVHGKMAEAVLKSLALGGPKKKHKKG